MAESSRSYRLVSIGNYKNFMWGSNILLLRLEVNIAALNKRRITDCILGIQYGTAAVGQRIVEAHLVIGQDLFHQGVDMPWRKIGEVDDISHLKWNGISRETEAEGQGSVRMAGRFGSLTKQQD